MFHLIGFIIFGLIVGLIARALMPGRQHMNLIATTVLGIIGSLIAGYFGQGVGWYGPNQSAGFIASIVGAIILLAIYHLIMRNRSVPGSSSSREFPRKAA